MITPEQLREWAQDADDGEDVALDGETLREIAERIEQLEADNSGLEAACEACEQQLYYSVQD